MEPEKTPKKKKKGTQFFSLGSVVVPPSGTGSAHSAHETSFYPFQAERLIIRATRERTIYTPRPPRWVQPLSSFKGRRTLKAAPGLLGERRGALDHAHRGRHPPRGLDRGLRRVRERLRSEYRDPLHVL